MIKPYCKFNNLDEQYLNQFESASGSTNYSSFQDFFTRVYKQKPIIISEFIWPCEGLFCDYGQISQLDKINIKGDLKEVKVIFGKSASHIPDDYYFSNVFLHNNNYHRIHAPIDAEIVSIEHLPGDLVLLRPWIYKGDPSLPAMRNERVNVTLKDEYGRKWYLSIVGGPAVGTIELNGELSVGSKINIGEELGKFLLGSTLCMAAPVPTTTPLNSKVYLAKPY